MSRLNDVLAGVSIALYATVGLFFLRFWMESRDRLFRFFAAAFFILAIQRVGVVLVADFAEHLGLLYGVRLVAFLLILAGIFDKNRRARGPEA